MWCYDRQLICGSAKMVSTSTFLCRIIQVNLHASQRWVPTILDEIYVNRCVKLCSQIDVLIWLEVVSKTYTWKLQMKLYSISYLRLIGTSTSWSGRRTQPQPGNCGAMWQAQLHSWHPHPFLGQTPKDIWLKYIYLSDFYLRWYCQEPPS